MVLSGSPYLGSYIHWILEHPISTVIGPLHIAWTFIHLAASTGVIFEPLPSFYGQAYLLTMKEDSHIAPRPYQGQSQGAMKQYSASGGNQLSGL
jgi:hypothetical protein